MMKKNEEGWWASVLADESYFEEAVSKNDGEKALAHDWEKAKKLYEEDAIISLEVIAHNHGGLLVAGEGLKGFVPHSHLLKSNNNDETKKEGSLALYHGKTLKLKLIECTPEEDRAVFSERAAQVGAGQRRELFNALKQGEVIGGEVTNITDFGVFVDIGGVEGLVHISELSWGRVGHPSQIVQMNQKIQVQILSLSPERCRVALSLKRLYDNPWENIHKKYQQEQVVPAKVTAIVSFGVFARLEEGIEGLIHSSEIPPSERAFLQNEAKIDVRILEIDAKKQRMGLSLVLEGKNG
jgi:small subunit ribosomal protein S1